MDRGFLSRDASEGSARPALCALRRGAALGVVFLSLGGCRASVESRPVIAYSAPVVYAEPVIVVTAAPEEIESYPRHRYHGRYVYLVDGRWYSNSRGRWGVYRSEPRDLVNVRVSYEAKYGRNYRPRRESRPQPRQDRR